jgi:hypothetical protein
MRDVAPRRHWASRLILVIAVVSCLMGMSHAHADHTMEPMSAAMHHSMPQPDQSSDTHHDHSVHAGDCCVATIGDSVQSVVTFPFTVDHAAVAPPAVLEGHAVALAPPQPRPPDLCRLGVQRT